MLIISRNLQGKGIKISHPEILGSILHVEEVGMLVDQSLSVVIENQTTTLILNFSMFKQGFMLLDIINMHLLFLTLT